MRSDLPGVNTLIRVQCTRDGQLHRSRVEALDGDGLLIAAPHAAGDPALPYVGDDLVLQWGSARGRCALPVRFERLEGARVLVWRLTARGVVQLTQRREYARASTQGTVTLVPATDAAAPVTGSVVDISEGGLRCLLPAGQVMTGVPVEVGLDLDDEAVPDVSGEVLRVDASSKEHDEVVLVLVPTAQQADAIRRHVYARQRHERRMGRW